MNLNYQLFLDFMKVNGVMPVDKVYFAVIDG